MSDKVEFKATFPPIMSAIKITGNDDGMRIQLDIPESEMGNAARLLLMRQEVLQVTIEVIEKLQHDRTEQSNPAIKRTSAKQRKR